MCYFIFNDLYRLESKRCPKMAQKYVFLIQRIKLYDQLWKYILKNQNGLIVSATLLKLSKKSPHISNEISHI